MALNAAKASGSNNNNRVEQPSIEIGNYPGRLVQILDLGLQPQRPYQGEEKPPAPEIMLTYELVDCFMVDEKGEEVADKPRWISETFPLRNIKADNAKSTKRYKALDPTDKYGGDFAALAGTPVTVNVVHGAVNKNTGKPYENVGSIAPMRARDIEKCPELKNPAKVFDLDKPDMVVFGSLPQWLQDKIKGNLNFNGSKLQAALGGEKQPEKAAPPPVEDEQEEDGPGW